MVTLNEKSTVLKTRKSPDYPKDYGDSNYSVFTSLPFTPKLPGPFQGSISGRDFQTFFDELDKNDV